MPECHRRAVHDRGKYAWWLLVFYAVPGVLGQSAKGTWVAVAAGMGSHIYRDRLPERQRRIQQIWLKSVSLPAAGSGLFGRQSGRPAKTIVEACRFHYQNSGQHKYDLHQRSGGKNPVQ
jgi:hypothetical protein